jgi:hypothetical protein
MSFNATLEKLAKKARITVRKLDKETVLIEGNSASLKFLGYLLISHADASDCGDQMSPRGAGSRLFSKESTLGFYIHRIPCKEDGHRKTKKKA